MPKTLLPGITDSEALEALGETMTSVFDRWGVDEPDRRRLLGTEQSTQPDTGRLLHDPAVLERIGQLLAIDRALARQAAATRELAAWWLRTPHAALSGESPLKIMLSQDLRGMQKIRTIVESETGRDS